MSLLCPSRSVVWRRKWRGAQHHSHSTTGSKEAPALLPWAVLMSAAACCFGEGLSPQVPRTLGRHPRGFLCQLPKRSDSSWTHIGSLPGLPFCRCCRWPGQPLLWPWVQLFGAVEVRAEGKHWSLGSQPGSASWHAGVTTSGWHLSITPHSKHQGKIRKPKTGVEGCSPEWVWRTFCREGVWAPGLRPFLHLPVGHVCTWPFLHLFPSVLLNTSVFRTFFEVKCIWFISWHVGNMQTFDPSGGSSPGSGQWVCQALLGSGRTAHFVPGEWSQVLVLKNYNAFVLQFLLRVKAILISQHIPAFIPLLQRPIFEGGMPCVAQIRIKWSRGDMNTWMEEKDGQCLPKSDQLLVENRFSLLVAN